MQKNPPSSHAATLFLRVSTNIQSQGSAPARSRESSATTATSGQQLLVKQQEEEGMKAAAAAAPEVGAPPPTPPAQDGGGEAEGEFAAEEGEEVETVTVEAAEGRGQTEGQAFEDKPKKATAEQGATE